MKIVTLDFESYYDRGQKYSLSSISTEAYVCDPRFQAIGVSAMIDDGPCDWFSGTLAETKEWLYQYDLWGSAVAGHHMLFDGLILQKHFGIVPRLYVDTLSMARPLLGSRLKSLSLAALAKHYGLGEKGDEVVRADGKRLEDFSPAELAEYGRYCVNDTLLTRALYKKLRSEMKRIGMVEADELRAIDQTLRMYLIPTLRLDRERLTTNLKIVQEKKAKALAELEVQGITGKVLRSNDQFAALLRARGIEPPMKLSPTALKKGEHKMTYAFAKADPEFIELQEEFADDIGMTMILNGRISEKSTQEETRTNTFIGMHDASGGLLRVPLSYAAAHTLRYGGIEGYNMQNPPRIDKSPMRFAILPPPGHTMIVSDLSQIEARIVALIAGQTDLVEAFARGEDVYSTYACELFGLPEGSISKALAKTSLEIENQRKVGKECLGPETLVLTLRGWTPILHVTIDDLVWDGAEWVTHQGLMDRGERSTETFSGVTATPDHEVLVAGDLWAEWRAVRTNPSLFQSALSSAILPSSDGRIIIGSGVHECGVSADTKGASADTISVEATARDATPAQKKPLAENAGGNTKASAQIRPIESVCSTEYPRCISAAKIPETGTISTMDSGEFGSILRGDKTAARFSHTSSLSPAGMSPNSNLTEQTATEAMSPGTFGSYPRKKTCGINAESKTLKPESANSKQKSRVYDLLNCGPRRRFTILTDAGPLLVSNSILGLGFGMGYIKFQRTLRGKAGLVVPLETCEGYVDFYRNKKYPKVPTLWKRIEYAFKDLMATGEETQIGPVRIMKTDGIATIVGPTGTRLWYPGLKFKDGQWTCSLARDKFPRNLFGGKWAENLVQFLANIIIKQKMIRVQRELDLWARLQAHDAIGWAVPTALAPEYAGKIDAIMKARVSWWPELPIDAETKTGLTYGHV